MIPIILLLLFSGYVLHIKGQENIKPKINDGMIDLQSWDFAKGG
jgi:hypothetical protein